jgi:hypothetical protein
MLVLSLSKDGPGLIDEDEALGHDPRLKSFPCGAPAGDVRTLLLAGRDTFLKLKPSRRRKRQSVSQHTVTPRAPSSVRRACSVRSGFSLRRANSQSRWPAKR